jgi:FKBP12-rapamycin complex-associated protein
MATGIYFIEVFSPFSVRLAACLSLKQLAINAPTTFHSKTSQSTLGQGGSNEFLDQIFHAIRDPQPIVRACAADALSQCLQIIVERRHFSMTGLLCQVYFALMEGLNQDFTRKKRPRQAVMAAEASQHGSLLVVSTMLTFTGDFMLPRYEEVCRAILAFRLHDRVLIRLEVIRLLPRLANANPKVFGRRFLEDGLTFLIESALNPTAPRVGVDIRPSAYKAIGELILAMMDEETGQVIGSLNAPTIKMTSDPKGPASGTIVELKAQGIVYERLDDIFHLVQAGLKSSCDTPVSSQTMKKGDSLKLSLSPVLHCAANLVAALGDLAKPYVPDLIDDMFRAGLSNDLIHCLQAIAQCVPDQQEVIEDRMLQEVSVCLAGLRDVYDPLSLTVTSESNIPFSLQPSNGNRVGAPGSGTGKIRIQMSGEPAVVHSLVLSLQTLASFGGTIRKTKASGCAVPLLPFVENVASRYLAHPLSEVRRAAALTCCALLLPYELACESRLGGYTGVIIDNVLGSLLRVAVSDRSGSVRICVVQALDSRYDSFLCQRHHLSELFLLLQDENLAIRTAGLRLLGRLAAINPATILPVMRRFLIDSIVEMQCGIYSGRGREEATRLCVVFLKAKPLQRLVQPVLPSLIDALPFHGAAPPRLAAASLEALGELALASGVALKPWIKDLVPRVLEIMADQSSASKQRTSLRTLGQIASATGYVIKPYLDHPGLLLQATDMLPATKRAPWSLRREVIRTLGIFGALDPDMQLSAALKARKGGAVGGAYFEEADFRDQGQMDQDEANDHVSPTNSEEKQRVNGTLGGFIQKDENLPAYLFMHEQYAMFAQPMSELIPAKRISPADEDFYPTVVVQALMRIFKDPNLTVHHSLVIQAVMYIFKSMGLGCVSYLHRVVPHMLSSIRTCVSSSLRESMLKQLARLSLIVREHLRPYVSDIFDVAESLWLSRHLATIFNLISNIAVGVPDAFHKFIPRLIRRLLSTFDDLQVADWTENENRNQLNRGKEVTERLHLLLYSLSSLKGVLGDYLHILIPALLKLADALASLGLNLDAGIPGKTLSDLSVMAFRTVSILIESKNAANNRVPSTYQGHSQFDSQFRESSEKGLPSRVVQPITRLIRDKPPRSIPVCLVMVETLCVCARLIGVSTWLKLYDKEVRHALFEWQVGYRIAAMNLATFTLDVVCDDHPQCLQVYDDFLQSLKNIDVRSTENSFDFATRFTLTPNTVYMSSIDDTPEAYEQQMILSSTAGATKHKVNQRNLQRAWDVSQRSSRDDWDEWMRRFSIQLLREAPAPALRSTASLAQAYQPLARELFSAAFACCWNELTNPFKANLVHALKTAFVADVSPEILQALLNLAEFMEYDSSGGLPIEIPVLADLSLKCRAYGKALHYKEREYSQGGGASCIESLISINRKLDLHGKFIINRFSFLLSSMHSPS